MKKLIVFIIMLFTHSLYSNDGAYYASGNQLIPITENDIRITKEILSIKQIIHHDEPYVNVTVDYTFFNPTSDKKILVGFEAASPAGDVNGYPKNGQHPYINNFSVTMNHKALDFKTAMVNTEDYYINNGIKGKTEATLINDDFNTNAADFYYVYYFDALFKKGINSIRHEYIFKMSSSIANKYDFDYILTAANRWANHQIDDFTLNIEIGNNEVFQIDNTFFSDVGEWKIENGKSFQSGNGSNFFVKTGKISFHKKNFQPNGELILRSSYGAISPKCERAFDYTVDQLPSKISLGVTCTDTKNEKSQKILRNLPYAIRGYIFKTPFIQAFYASQYWYEPDASYKANRSTLSNDEQ